ncbi:MAG: DMT family transporter [Hymenobacteraceae bacterium]|nr:DMT family transporter [Hymenobacteraceae bacterium]
MKELGAGVLFVFLWASASVATKLGIQSCPPLTLAALRLVGAGVLLCGYVYGVRRRYPLPAGGQWPRLAVLAFLNTTVYLGAYVLALRTVPAGLASLFVAINPLLITLFSAGLLRRRVAATEWLGLLLALAGLGLCAVPVLRAGVGGAAGGLWLLGGGMVSYSLGSVLFARFALPLPTLVVNAWQVLLGGVALVPLIGWLGGGGPVVPGARFWGALGWLVGPVSIGAVQLWLRLLARDAVDAGKWLYLVPLVGYGLAYALLGEPITGWAMGGTAVALAGVAIGRVRRS